MRTRYDLIIVGMGSGGVVAAEFAARLGLRVAAVERARVGGDCLWTGCVPSKALLASARAAHAMRAAADQAVEPREPGIDSAAVLRRIREVQGRIAATDDSPERFRGLGVDVHEGEARIAGPRAVTVGGQTLTTSRTLLCTGSRPRIPDLPGMEEAAPLTSETVWDLERAPASLLVLGGGPIAVEMAQGFARLGTSVQVLQRGPRLLARDEPELVERLTARLRAEGVAIALSARVERLSREDGNVVAHGSAGGRPARWAAERLLVGAGREPHVEGLGLEEVGVETGPKGVKVDERSRTSVPSIYAAGDVTGRDLFTHAAAQQAAMAVRDMFLPGAGRVEGPVPWCTFTEPELAHAGLTEAQARERHGDRRVRSWRIGLEHSDRARADAAEDGMLVAVTHRGRLVGAHVLAPAAGEAIGELALAIQKGMRLMELSSLVHVYPTLSTSVAQLAAQASWATAARWRWLVRAQAARLATSR